MSLRQILLLDKSEYRITLDQTTSHFRHPGRCIEGIVGFSQPILDLICAHTGMKATLIVGGPEPADGGRLNIIRYGT